MKQGLDPIEPQSRPESIEALNLRLAELMHRHNELFDRLRADQQHFARLARSVWRVQEDERRRLARELHDGIGQNLAALIHQIRAAVRAVPAQAETALTALSALNQAQELAQATLEDTRALSRLLRPQILDDLGLEPALRWLVRTLSAAPGLHIRIDVDPLPLDLNADVATLIFRIAQESLGNVVKHAQATLATLALHCDGERLILSISDDGRGCDPAAAFAVSARSESTGLGGMRDRARLFGGEFVLKSGPGAGCTITLRLPLIPT